MEVLVNPISIAIIIIGILVAVIILVVNKIKMARLMGKKLEKKNAFYKIVANIFLKDLPK